MAKLFVFLGNPGSEYERTRHNVAWMILDYFSLSKNLSWSKKFKGFVASLDYKGEKFIFLKPQTFMNLSGESAVAAKQFYKIENSDVLVVHDELDIPFGQIQFKFGGGVAGHNGLKSLQQHLGGPDFRRLRIGISRPVHGTVSNYVLSAFDDIEKANLDRFLQGAADALFTYVDLGYELASTKFSKKNFLA